MRSSTFICGTIASRHHMVMIEQTDRQTVMKKRTVANGRRQGRGRSFVASRSAKVKQSDQRSLGICCASPYDGARGRYTKLVGAGRGSAAITLVLLLLLLVHYAILVGHFTSSGVPTLSSKVYDRHEIRCSRIAHLDEKNIGYEPVRQFILLRARKPEDEGPTGGVEKGGCEGFMARLFLFWTIDGNSRRVLHGVSIKKITKQVVRR